MFGVEYVEGRMPLDLPGGEIVEADFKVNNAGTFAISFNSQQWADIVINSGRYGEPVVGFGLYLIKMQEAMTPAGEEVVEPEVTPKELYDFFNKSGLIVWLPKSFIEKMQDTYHITKKGKDGD